MAGSIRYPSQEVSEILNTTRKLTDRPWGIIPGYLDTLLGEKKK